MPLSLKQQLQLQGTPELINLMVEVCTRLDRLELALLEDRQRPRRVTTCAGPAMPNREVVEDLGNGWQIVRTAMPESPLAAQDGPGRAQPPEPV